LLQFAVCRDERTRRDGRLPLIFELEVAVVKRYVRGRERVLPGSSLLMQWIINSWPHSKAE
jgi:hypothetical protein